MDDRVKLGGGYIKIVGGGGRKGSKEAGVVFRICTCNLIERYERGSWCGGEVDPGGERWSLLGLGELSCCWHNGTRGPVDLESGGGAP